MSLSARWLFILLLTSSRSVAIPAFPGAEGAGANALGGRGGDVYHVTNTNSSGAGSLADGVATVPAAGRTIVFDVSGYAHVSTMRLTASKLTIAGQTAPGDGFGLKDGVFRVSGDDFVCRHFRFRYGKQAAGGDAVDLDSGSLNSIFDHCCMEFSTDENMSSFGSPPENLTFQWSINAWGLESHSCGGLWDQNHATSHHSLWAHNHTRNPKARPSLLDWVNNVTFDWDIGFILADSQTPANWNANVVGNYFLSTTSKSKALEKGGLDRNGAWNFHLFMSNNRLDGNVNGVLDGTDTGFGMVSGDVEHLAAAVVNTGIPVTVDDPLVAFKKIASSAGPLRLESDAAKPLRDEPDTILLSELMTQTRHHVTSEAGSGAANGGIGLLNSTAAPADSDRDGMPDYWETALGWTVATDDHNTSMANSGGLLTGTTFFPAGTVAGYTRLEEYLHYLCIPHGVVSRNTTTDPTALDVDLRKYTSGFAVTPTFTLSNVVGGVVTQSGSGGSLVHFVPMVDTNGRARFEFKVQDAAGSQWTQTFAVLVSTAALPRDLKWKGDGTANAWNTSTTNFLRGTSPTTFGPGDAVTFDDSGSHAPTLNLAASVAPGPVSVSGAGNYTVSGAGAINSGGALRKAGSGTLTFTNTGPNSFTGVTLEEGAIGMNNGSSIGTGPLTLLGGTLMMGGSMSNPLAILGTVNVYPGGNFLTGSWTGSGRWQATLSNVTHSLQGDMSAFSGTVAMGTSTGFLRFYGVSGSSLATFDLGTNNVTMSNRNGGGTVNLGSLSGGVNTTLTGSTSTTGVSTYVIGALNTSTTFAGHITDGGQGAAAITKLGTGAWTLTGTSTHSGATTVSAGELILNGTLGNTPLTVASGAKLRGTGSTTGSVTLASGSQLSPGAATGLVGTMSLGAAGLNLQGTTLSFQLSNSPTGANDKVTLTGGTLALSGVNPVVLSLTDGELGPGIYDLISGGATTTGTGANLSSTLPTGSRQSFGWALPVGKLQLQVTGNAASLLWSGGLNAATWDVNTTANFTGATPGTFYDFDAVTFDDTSVNRAVNVAAIVAPRALTVNTTAGYSLGGTGAVGGGSLTKTGNGVLTISNTNSYIGGTNVNAGSIQLANAAANASGLGAGIVKLSSGTVTMYDAGLGTHAGTLPNAIQVVGSGTLRAAPRGGFSGAVTGSGTFTYYTPYVRADITGDWSGFTGQVNVITDGDGGDFRIASGYGWPGLPLAAINLADRVALYFSGTLASGDGTTISIGELSGSALAFVKGGATGGRNFTYLIGSRNTDAVYAGTISEQNTTTTTQYVKTGSGNWTLGGICNWRGGTTVETGTLTIGGSVTCASTTDVQSGATLCLAGGTLACDALNIATGATLCGKGTVLGDLNNDGTVLAATGGTLSVTGEVVNNGLLRIASGTALVATGAVVNNGVLDLLTASGGLPANLVNNGTIIDSNGLNLLSAGKSGNAFTLSILGISGHSYQLQRTASSTLGGWADVGAAQAGNGSALTFTDPTGATLGKRFYRLVVTP